MVAQYSLQGCIQFDVVFIEVDVELLCAQHPCYLLQLVMVVYSLEERLLVEYHAGHHHAQRPYVQRVVVVLIGD